ncbi:hypothetical protein SJA_C1-28790 [Sphingobium indicum UT26S]|uniref:Uncharacterized protein n=1 Tax=Sphingobium indicum (strain DSM 16413 / CCM 7287 / MTCC 6362 / UT26 / NBRC 101211 / UT26S) TaxID=452662 RepID=D4Z531_SPHIU|nr:hypothetical protein SJA_C1-28790 [Sphingobium indicum UT26S]
MLAPLPRVCGGFSSGRGENSGFRELARSVLQYVSTGSAESRYLQPAMG